MHGMRTWDLEQQKLEMRRKTCVWRFLVFIDGDCIVLMIYNESRPLGERLFLRGNRSMLSLEFSEK